MYHTFLITFRTYQNGRQRFVKIILAPRKTTNGGFPRNSCSYFPADKIFKKLECRNIIFRLARREHRVLRTPNFARKKKQPVRRHNQRTPHSTRKVNFGFLLEYINFSVPTPL